MHFRDFNTYKTKSVNRLFILCFFQMRIDMVVWLRCFCKELQLEQFNIIY